MAPRRIGSVSRADTIAIEVDGEAVAARPGEPVAVAIAAAGRVVLGRSVKYHRPRGATCYAGRCDGCLMRVDGRPNVMTCRIPARAGMKVETQNVLGSAETDLLAAADWFFAGGMDHHRMFTWSKPVNRAMQKVARRIAGIGRIPDEVEAIVPPRDAACDVLVVGAGAAGLAAAAELASRGLAVTVVEENEQPGGALRIFPGEVEDDRGARVAARDLAARLAHKAAGAGRGATMWLGHGAVGVYDEDGVVAIESHEGLVRMRAKKILVAAGEQEGAVAIEGGDRPGVIGSRAACVLLAHGVVPGGKVAVAGEGAWADAVVAGVRAAGAEVVGPFALADLRAVKGRPAMSGVEVETAGRRQVHACDTLVVAPTPAGLHEIAAQAGARVRWGTGGFEVEAAPGDGATASPRVRAAGGCTGLRSVAQSIAQARAAAKALAEELT